MLFYLIKKNIWAKPAKSILILASLSLTITLAVLLTAFNNALTDFIFAKTSDSSLGQLTVKPKGSTLELNALSLLPKPKLTGKMLENISKIAGVSSVEPQTAISGISSLQIPILGQTLQTDSLVFGTTLETIKKDLKNEQEWTSSTEPYPALASTQLLDLYNYSFANSNNLPHLKPENLIGTEITILLNQSTFFNQGNQNVIPLKAKIIGFSPKVKLLGITLPNQIIESINQTHLQNSDKNYLEAIVKTKQLDQLPAIKKALIDLNFIVESPEDSIKNLDNYFQIINFSLAIFFTFLGLLSGLLIILTFLNKISEQQKQIGILKAIGLNKNQISLLYLGEAAILGVIASLIGNLAATIIAFLANQFLASFFSLLQTKPEKFFLITPNTIIFSSLLCLVLCSLFAYFPARKAAKLEPGAILSK